MKIDNNELRDINSMLGA